MGREDKSRMFSFTNKKTKKKKTKVKVIKIIFRTQGLKIELEKFNLTRLDDINST